MNPLFVALLGAVAGTLIVLGRRLSRLAAAALILRRQMSELEAAAAALPPASRGGERTVIEIEILNPMQLAVKENALAEPLGGLTPALLRKLVYRRASEIIAVQLREQGVQAVVRVHELR